MEIELHQLPEWFPRLDDIFLHRCRVCGWVHEKRPWGDDGWRIPSFSICACCGCEIGLEDTSHYAVASFRTRWFKEGIDWFNPKLRPADWDITHQLAFVPPPFSFSPLVTTTEEFIAVIEELGLATACRARFEGGEEQAESIVRKISWTAGIMSCQPYMSEGLFRAIVHTKDHVALRVLRKRPEPKWREEWNSLLANAV